jgi:hypothetical protein
MTDLNALVVFAKVVAAKSFSATAGFGGNSNRSDLRKNQRLCRQIDNTIALNPVAWVRPFMTWDRQNK